MIETMREILEGVLARLRAQLTTWLPSVLAALIILAGAYLLALGVRWALGRMFKGAAMDRFLRRSGLAFLIDSSGRLRATRLVSEAAYWAILLAGLLTGLSAFNTSLTSELIHNFVLLLPKLAVAALILLGGFWLGHYLARSVLVWAVNENIPFPRRIAAGVRVITLFVAIVASADYLNFARGVFLAAFIILLGASALAASLAIGLGGRDAVRRYLEERKSQAGESGARSLWNHL